MTVPPPTGLFSAQGRALLEGRAFDGGVVCDVRPEPLPGGTQDRLDLLAAMVRGQRVVHIGCADHLPLIDAKIAAGTWLHGRMAATASALRGFDIAADAIEHLRSRHQIADLHVVDPAEAPTPLITDGRWDVLVLGEMIEHLDDPVGWLSRVRRHYAGAVSDILVTVPNAWSLTNVRQAFRGREFINSDHRFWFTPFTLAKVLTRAGCLPQRYWTVPAVPRARRALITRGLERAFPLLREVLVMRARLQA